MSVLVGLCYKFLLISNRKVVTKLKGKGTAVRSAMMVGLEMDQKAEKMKMLTSSSGRMDQR